MYEWQTSFIGSRQTYREFAIHRDRGRWQGGNYYLQRNLPLYFDPQTGTVKMKYLEKWNPLQPKE